MISDIVRTALVWSLAVCGAIKNPASAGVNQDLSAILTSNMHAASKTEAAAVALHMKKLMADPDVNPQLAEQAAFWIQILSIKDERSSNDDYWVLWEHLEHSTQAPLLRDELVFTLWFEIRGRAAAGDAELAGLTAQLTKILIAVLEEDKPLPGTDLGDLINFFGDVDPEGALAFLERLNQNGVLWEKGDAGWIYRWLHLKQQYGHAGYEDVEKLLLALPLEAHFFDGLINAPLVSSKTDAARFEGLMATWKEEVVEAAEQIEDEQVKNY